MTAATVVGAAGGYRAYLVTGTVTIDLGAGAVVERVVCVASSSGTLKLGDAVNTFGTALSLAAKDSVYLNMPFRGTLTATVGGTLEAYLIIKT